MFRWRSERHRVKAVFKLHFHVTQIVQSGVDALVLSIVPGDIGKVTTRLEKAAVRDGVCRWENPVYETIKFVQEPKTGKFSERVYHFVVSTGLSKASFFGQVSIDFAEYAEATKPSTVSLPIKNSHCDAVLHVSVQRLQENNDKREDEDCEDTKLKPNDRSLRTYLSNGEIDAGSKSDSSEDVSAKANTNGAELSADCRTSSGSDITISSSDGSSGLDTPRELGLRNDGIHPNNNGFLSDVSHTSEPQKPSANASAAIYDIHQRSHWDWERSLQASDMEIERLKAELAALARQVDVSDLELQTLRKQIVKESKRGQELSKEIISLKEERDALKVECESLRSFHKRMEDSKVSKRPQLDSGDLCTLVEEIRQELKYEKELNANLQLQLKKTQESNAELVLAVQDLDEMLEQKNRKVCSLSNKHEQGKNSHELGGNLSKCETDDDEEQKELEELVKEHSNAKETHLLEQKIIDLYGEIEMYRRDKDELEMQMEQLALDYEILKQENHDIAYKLEQSELQEQLKMQYECSSPPPGVDHIESHIQNLENQLKQQSEEFSNSLATIKELESQISRLEEELEKQAQGFEADLDTVTREKVEQEQRAIRAEEALRNTRHKNANTAERLQEEFRRLSTQMASTFEANEKATMRALTEASELRVQKRLVEEMLHKVNKELQSLDELRRVKHLKDEKEMAGRVLQSELEALRVQYSDLKSSLIEDESEKENLRKQVFELKGELKKKDDALSNIEKRFKDSNGRAQLSDGTKTNSKNKKGASIPQNSKEMASLRDKIKTLEGMIRSKENALEMSASSFLDKERELQSKIEELEDKVEEFNQSISLQKVVEDKSITTSNDTTRVSEGNGVAVSLFNSNGNLSETLAELSLLKERNNSMETELKELQQRYSEMSLKFAEVEGERQKLVMTVRNLKNGRKAQ
uniref:Laminin subunit alpha-2 n=1 Tax=Cajanus cajan TaxID=3821 RepID=A0A151TF36_CAJCA|nr:Laminin subunit alpha-2 [Cajanus cajan]